MRSQKIILLFIIALFCYSCQNENIYQNAGTIPSSGWATDQPFYFQDSIPFSAPENIGYEIDIRHSNIYPYQNIWLYIQTKSSDGETRSDSINWQLSGKNGRWLGKGWGSLYNVSYRLPNLVIKKSTQKRWFQIKIEHGLRDQILTGIEDIGIRLFPIRDSQTSDSTSLLPVGIKTQEDKK